MSVKYKVYILQAQVECYVFSQTQLIIWWSHVGLKMLFQFNVCLTKGKIMSVITQLFVDVATDIYQQYMNINFSEVCRIAKNAVGK